jgi:alpha-glucoside transport system substrate-binding protein
MVGLVATLLVAAACGSDSPPAADDAPIEVFGPYQDLEADRFGDVLAEFQRSTGIAVRYVGSSDFVSDLQTRVGVGQDPPDVAVVPQPGVVDELVDDQLIVPVPDEVRDVVLASYASAASGGDEALYVVPFRLTIKSLVWYRPDVFEEYGWSIPESLDELTELVRLIQRESELAPWCFGISAGTATGWPATDWTEDLVARRVGADEYQRWAVGELPFESTAIADAFEEFEQLVLAPGRVNGGLATVIETSVPAAGLPLFDDPPGCVLYKQADFAASWMPDGTSIGPDGDVDFFALPPAVAGEQPPIVLGGDQIVQFTSRPEVDELMAYLAGSTAAEVWIRQGGFTSANTAVSEDAYPEGYAQALVAVVDSADALVFDASDQMPATIGSGLLWRQITDWVAGVVSYSDFASVIDAALRTSASDTADAAIGTGPVGGATEPDASDGATGS